MATVQLTAEQEEYLDLVVDDLLIIGRQAGGRVSAAAEAAGERAGGTGLSPAQDAKLKKSLRDTTRKNLRESLAPNVARLSAQHIRDRKADLLEGK